MTGLAEQYEFADWDWDTYFVRCSIRNKEDKKRWDAT